MRVDMGFNSRYRDGSWVPIRVTLHNDGPDFSGTVSVSLPSPYAGMNTLSPSSNKYQQAISLSSGAQKQITLNVPMLFGSQGVTQTVNVNLLDANGKLVLSQPATLRSLGPNDILAGVLSDQSAGISSLGQVTQPNQTASVFEEQLNAATMPKIAEILTNFDVIVLDNFTTSSLSNEQLTALQNWVAQGGTLIVTGGPEWRRTLSALPAGLLPVNIAGTSTLPAGTDLFPVGGPTKSGPGENSSNGLTPGPVTISTATAVPGSTVLLSAGPTPLIVQNQYEQGAVYYFAFDPTLTPLANWPNAADLWKGILIRTLGDRFLDASQNPNPYGFPRPMGGNNWESLLQSLFPNAFPATWLILVLLIGYVVILGPVRLVIVRLFKRRTWNWRIVLATIAIFSLLSYGLAIQQKGTSIISSSISVIRLDRGTAAATNAHVTSYLGVFVPSQGDFHVHIAGGDLVQSASSAGNGMYQAPGASYNAGQTIVTNTPDGTDVDLQGVDIWTLRSLEAKRDTQIKGGIIPHLTIQNGQLTGTVTNTLPYGLTDAYVLIGDQYLSLGHVAAGQSQAINLPLNNNPGNSPPPLADQIAGSHGLPTPYVPYALPSSQGQNDFQRHMAMLSTLSGEAGNFYCGGGGTCYQAVSIANGNVKQIIYGGKGSQGTGRDPLLLEGADATFIGWTDQTPDLTSKVTINGITPGGTQEAMVQAPLDVQYAGSLNPSSNLVLGQLVDIQGQGSSIQSQFSGIYTLTTGSLTFEFALPNNGNVHANALTISESTNVVNGVAPGGSNNVGDLSHVHTYMYNWRTGNWDAVNFNQSTLSLTNAQPYINAQGRVLIQVSNQDSAQGTIVVTKPLLQLQGQVSR